MSQKHLDIWRTNFQWDKPDWLRNLETVICSNRIINGPLNPFLMVIATPQPTPLIHRPARIQLYDQSPFWKQNTWKFCMKFTHKLWAIIWAKNHKKLTWSRVPGIIKKLLAIKVPFRPSLAPRKPPICEPIAPPSAHSACVNDIAINMSHTL